MPNRNIPGLSLLVFIVGLFERCWRNSLFSVFYWYWWNSWESGQGPGSSGCCAGRLLSQQHWQETALFCKRKKMSLCGCNSSKSGHNPKSDSENSASSFNLFIPSVCAGRVCSVYWSKQDFISVLSVEETSGLHSRLSLILPFLLFYFCLFT